MSRRGISLPKIVQKGGEHSARMHIHRSLRSGSKTGGEERGKLCHQEKVLRGDITGS